MISALTMSNNLSHRLPNPDMPKLRCMREFDFSTLPQPCRDFGLRGIVNPDAIVSGLLTVKPQNSMPPVHSLTPVAPHCSLSRRDIAFHDFAILVAMFTGLQPMKPRYGQPRINPMALVARIYSPAPPEI
jgi:hypothetical protein